MTQTSRLLLGCAALAIAAGATPAHARVFFGVGFGFPLVVAPPVVVAPYPYPPAYYPPAYYPQAYYPPQAVPNQTPIPRDNVPYGSTCFAGFYTCAAAPKSQVGSGCSCPGLGAPSYGSVR